MITRDLNFGLRLSRWIFRPWVVIYTWPNYEDNAYALSKGCVQRSLRLYIITSKPFSKVPSFWQLNQTQVKPLWKFNPASLILFYFSSATFSSHGGLVTYLTESSRRVNVWHGIPLKSVGVKRGDKPPTPSGFALSTSPKGTELMRSMYDEKTPDFLEIGFPRNDLIIQNSKLNSRIGRLVYLPTYRMSHRGMAHADGKQYENGLCLSNRELQELDKVLISKNVFLDIVAHPMGKVTLPQDLHNIMIVNQDNFRSSLYSTLGKYDALISDYSSVIIDFLLCEKPIIVFSPDELEYRDTRGLNLEISDIPGTFFADDVASLVNSIDEVYQGESKKVLVERWHIFNDSNSTARLLDFFFSPDKGVIPKKLSSLTKSIELLQASLYSALLGLLFPIAVLLTQPHRVFAGFWLFFSMTVFSQAVFRNYCENAFAFNQNEIRNKVSMTGIGLIIAIIFSFLGFFVLAKVQEISTWRTLFALTIINVSQYQIELVRSSCIAGSALREASLISKISFGLHSCALLLFLIFSSFFGPVSETITLFYSAALLTQALVSKRVQASSETARKLVTHNSKSSVGEIMNWSNSLYGLVPVTLANIVVNYLLVSHNLDSSLAFIRGTQIILTPIAFLSNLQIWIFDDRVGFNEFFNRRLLLLSSVIGLPLFTFSLFVLYQDVSSVTLLCGLFILGEVLINLRSNFYQLSIRAEGKLFALGTYKIILALIQVSMIYALILVNGLSPLTFGTTLAMISILNYQVLSKGSREF